MTSDDRQVGTRANLSPDSIQQRILTMRARALVLKLIQNAKRSLILIDNRVTVETLDLFAKKRNGAEECCHCGTVASNQFQFPMKEAA